MGIVIRQGIKGAILSYMGVLIGAFSYLYLFPKYLDTAQIGVLRFFQDTAMFLAVFVQLGSSTVLYRFFPGFSDNDKKHHGFLTLSVIYPVVPALLFIILFWGFEPYWLSLFADNSPEIIEYFHLIIPLTLVVLYIRIFEAYSKTNLLTVIPTFYKEVLLRVFILLLILLYAFNQISFSFAVNGLLVAYLLYLLLTIGYLSFKGILYLPLKINWSFFRPYLKEVFSFAGLIYLVTLSSIIIGKIDILMIGSMLGMDELGIFTITFFMASIIEMPKRAINQISVPLISQAWKDNDMKQIEFIYQRSAINQFIICGLLFILIWTNTDFIFHFMPESEKFQKGLFVILFIGLSKVIDVASGPNIEIIVYSNKYWANLIFSIILAILLFISNQILIPLYGINGAAFATMVSVSIWNAMKMIYLKINYGLSPFNKSFLGVTVLFIIAYFAADFISLDNIWADFLLKSSISTAILLGLSYFFNLSTEIRETIDKTLARIKL